MPASAFPRRTPLRPLLVAALVASLLGGCSDSPEKMLASARGYLASQDLQAASIQLKNALQKDGSLAEARFLLGQVNLQLGDVPGAVKELQRAEELGYPAEQVSPWLVRALVQSAEFDRVIERYASVTLADANAQATVLSGLGQAYLAKASLQPARTAYEGALAADPDNLVARIGLARTKFFAGDLDGAEADVEAVLGSDPKAFEAHVLKVDVMLARQRPEAAIDALRAALELDPAQLPVRYELANLLLRMDRIDEARAEVEQMKRTAPDSPSTLYLQASLDFRDGRIAESRDAVLKSLERAPNFLPGQLLAGTTLFRLNEHVTAQVHLNKVLERMPGQVQALRLLGLSLLATAQPGRALEVVRPLIDANADDPASLTVIGQVQLANGNFDGAAESFARATRLDPDSAEARMRLGVARLARGDAAAFADLEAATVLDPDGAQADTALVLAHLRANNFDAALRAVDTLLSRHPQNAEAHNLKGGVMLARRDFGAARASFDEALRLRPDLLAAVINLARVDVAEQQTEAAVARFEAFIKANPRNIDAYLAAAELKQISGASDADILSTLERAAAAAPAALPPKLALVRHHLRVRDTRRALAVAQEAAAANNNDPGAVEALARAQFAHGEHQQALSSYGRLTSLLPQSPAPHVEMAGVHWAMKDVAGTEQALRRALAVRADFAEANRRLLAILLEQQREDDALVHARAMQRVKGAELPGVVAEGDILARKGEWPAAAAAYARALQLNRNGELLAKQHAALLRAGRNAEGERLLGEWLRSEPRDVVVRSYLAERALAERRLQDARRIYREILAIAPDSALVLNNLAWVAGQLGDADAVELAERALALAPDNPAILDTLGVLQVERGQVDQGLANLNRAVSLAPALGQLRLSLAKAYLGLGRKDEARRELDTVLQQSAAGTPLHTEATALRGGL
ncbi:XrtA/PEP-CTERM system TPR-repeat protein PrsT [Pseudothauera lacus]|uniref:XrtA/PEP-CTERM system TPR-repeat protein PrsT n=1 Tax=Pseudothauera lacus TaxID=2136175 RepID=UPI0015E6DC54|nr:XrtA/PEP-CTERM system TPR-repeat protein PrsT [Pseudothauera lacus]